MAAPNYTPRDGVGSFYTDNTGTRYMYTKSGWIKAAVQTPQPGQASAKQATTSSQQASIDAENAKINQYNLRVQAANDLINAMKQKMIDLDRQLSNIPSATLSDTKKDQILQKAIQQNQAWYDSEKTRIEQGIQEGKIRQAEDYYIELRKSENSLSTQLKQYDLTEAQTQEELVNRLAELTSNSTTDLELKKIEWTNRLRENDQQNAQSNLSSSGVALQKRNELRTQADLEKKRITDLASQGQINAETRTKYQLENIRLARESAQKDQEIMYGNAEERAAKLSQARQMLGLADNQDVSALQIDQNRLSRGVSPISNSQDAYANLEEQRKINNEATRLSLTKDELTLREQQRKQAESAILSQKNNVAQQYQSLISRFT